MRLKGALEVAKEITNDYKKNIPKQSGLLKQSVKAVSSYTLEKGVYRAASVVFRMKEVGIKRFEKLKMLKNGHKQRKMRENKEWIILRVRIMLIL
ncbi:hypothetical protein [Campylobacter jejuni]|uniref:hypothetical protein n=1 Tax=Campylobacter jejuni TaxID=197 RepID=UPI0020CCC045|nr:hypothetical protein [Campylobacter jejuni]